VPCVADVRSVELLRKRTIRYSSVGFPGIYTLLERLSWAHCINSRGWIEKGSLIAAINIFDGFVVPMIKQGKSIVRRCE
jgi:hypothetical protein